MDEIRIMVIEPKRTPYVTECENTLKAKQRIVDGYIEVTKPPTHDDDVVIICNEEGKLRGLEPNRAVRLSDGTVYDIIKGVFFLCRAPYDSDDFASLTDEQIEKYAQLYAV